MNYEDVRNKVYSTIDEYTPLMPENSDCDLIEENLSLYNQLAEIDGAVPYVLKYVLEAEDSRKGDTPATYSLPSLSCDSYLGRTSILSHRARNGILPFRRRLFRLEISYTVLRDRTYWDNNVLFD